MVHDVSPGDNIGIFCINIADDLERRASIRRQFDALGIHVTFVEAVVGRDVAGAHEGHGANAAKHRKVSGGGLLDNEVACILSHKKALARFLGSDLEFALILEDDAVIHGDIGTFLSSVGALGGGLSWDVLRLFSKQQGRSYVVTTVAGFKICASLNYSFGAVANCYTRTGAQKVINCFTDFYLPFDTQLGRVWENKIRIFNVEPCLFGDCSTPSRIDPARERQVKVQRAGTALWSTFVWRLKASILKRMHFYAQILSFKYRRKPD